MLLLCVLLHVVVCCDVWCCVVLGGCVCVVYVFSFTLVMRVIMLCCGVPSCVMLCCGVLVCFVLCCVGVFVHGVIGDVLCCFTVWYCVSCRCVVVFVVLCHVVVLWCWVVCRVCCCVV